MYIVPTYTYINNSKKYSMYYESECSYTTQYWISLAKTDTLHREYECIDHICVYLYLKVGNSCCISYLKILKADDCRKKVLALQH